MAFPVISPLFVVLVFRPRSASLLKLHGPGIFDCVFAGIRASSGDNENQNVIRYIVTDDVRGWKGKVRDEKRRLAAVEKTGSVVDLFKRMELSDEDFKKYQKTQEQSK